jgi:hypothetical protein
MRDRVTFRPEFIVADAFMKAEHTARNFSPGARKGVRLLMLLFIALIVNLTSDVATFGAAKKNVRAYLKTTATIECYVSSGTWQNDPFSNQTAPFVAQFNMTPNTAHMDGVTGLSLDDALAYSNLAAIVRFNVTGFMDAIDGDNYRADTVVAYSPGITYHYRLLVYPASHMYTIYVTVPGSAETVLGSNFRFRSDQSATSQLNYWSLFAEKPSHTVCGFGISAFGSSDKTSPTTHVTHPQQAATVFGTVNISADASDDIGVVGVQLKVDGKPIGSEFTALPYARSWNTVAISNGTHILTATARDAAGNATTSTPVTVIVDNVPSPAKCPASTSIWQNTPIATQSNQFQASFDATPNLANMDVVTGFSLGTADAYPRLAASVRFNTSGFIDARNGGSFTANTAVRYVAGQTYHFRLLIDPSTHHYTIYVTPPGSQEITLGTNFAFRINFSRLNYWAFNSAKGSLSVCNFKVGP